jgi:oxygen-independent coproporphyrinogen-3 oxidase
VSAQHLYVHVPFCARRCTYCDFSIAVRARLPLNEYLQALAREVARVGPAGAPATVYLGGGTPSRLGGPGVAALVRLLDLRGPVAEFTLEANPEDLTPDAARAWANVGVTRASIGAQSFDDRVLGWMHRTHDAAAIGAAVRSARAGGIRDVSLDLIFALPAALQRDFACDLECAIACEPDHLSLYGLTVEPGTALARQVERGEWIGAPDGRYEDEYLRAHEALRQAGYRFYEVSNAAREGREAVHNRAYWRLHPYLGLGPSAHSFDGVARWWNEPAYARWVRRLERGESPVAGREIPSDAQRRLELLYLSLRTADGIAVPEPCPVEFEASMRRWAAAGWAEIVDLSRGALDLLAGEVGPGPSRGSFASGPAQGAAGGRRLSLTPAGWLRLDELVASI